KLRTVSPPAAWACGVAAIMPRQSAALASVSIRLADVLPMFISDPRLARSMRAARLRLVDDSQCRFKAWLARSDNVAQPLAEHDPGTFRFPVEWEHPKDRDRRRKTILRRKCARLVDWLSFSPILQIIGKGAHQFLGRMP